MKSIKLIKHKKKPKEQQGFILVEMIVSISLFVTVILIIVGTLVSLNNAVRTARAIRITNDNLTSAIDSMSRNIRMGTYFHCGCPSSPADAATPRSCIMTDGEGGGGDTCFAFESQHGDKWNDADQIVYKADNGRLWRSLDGGLTYSPLTAPELMISAMKFYVQGTATKKNQPVVTIVLQGTANSGKTYQTEFNIQTTVGARAPNYDKIL